MNVTIIGTGNGGSAIAADLTAKGNNITLFKSSKKGNSKHFKNLINNQGLIKIKYPNGEEVNSRISLITDNIKEALREETEVIILFLPTIYQENIIKSIIPYLHNGEIIILEPGYLGTAYFIEFIKDIDITIVEAESSPLDCRITAPGEITVYFKNYCNPIGVYPNSNKERTLKKLSKLSYNFIGRHNVIEAALHNPNLIVHTIGGILSIPRIENTNGDYWMYKEVFTPTVWNLINALDEEKMNIMESLNLPRISYLEEAKTRNAKPSTDYTAIEVFQDYAKNYSVKGPEISDSRYIREDVPQGLGLLQSFGKWKNIPTPICNSLIELSSALLKEDFKNQARTIEKLGENNIIKILEDTLQ